LKYVGDKIVKYDFECVEAPFIPNWKRSFRVVKDGKKIKLYSQIYKAKKIWLGRCEAWSMGHAVPTGEEEYEGEIEIIGKREVRVNEISRMSYFYKFFNDDVWKVLE